MLDEKATTLYKRALDQQYSLKIKASRTVFNEITQRFPTMPFTLRALPGRETRLGLHECLNHALLHPYPVLHEKARQCLFVKDSGFSKALMRGLRRAWACTSASTTPCSTLTLSCTRRRVSLHMSSTVCLFGWKARLGLCLGHSLASPGCMTSE